VDEPDLDASPFQRLSGEWGDDRSGRQSDFAEAIVHLLGMSQSQQAAGEDLRA
jgi:hypothetical protein